MPETLRRTGLALLALLALALASPAAAQTTLLTGFGDFEGAESQVTFEGLGLMSGDPVSVVDGVGFATQDGDPIDFYEDAFAREQGPFGLGAVANFWTFGSPYPDLHVVFPGTVHRVAFELRANPSDDVAVTLFAGGVEVDTVVVPSRGSDMLYFYGYENLAGFDEVRIDVVANVAGAFALDNLTHEALAVEEPPVDEPPVLACKGFGDPFGRHRRYLVRPLVAKLVDAQGHVVPVQDVDTAPAVRVMFQPDDGSDPIDVTEQVVYPRHGHFVPTRRGNRWFIWQMRHRMKRPGVYLTTLESGDPTEYTVAPTCSDWIVKERSRPHWRKNKHKHRHHRRDR